MKKTNSAHLILGAIGMLILILDGKTAIVGMRAGIQLCLQTLVPSLFPFFILSALVTGSLIGRQMGPFNKICHFCHMPDGAVSLLAVGLLGGYPVGAGNIANEIQHGNLSREDAQRMVVFCNNPGPSFLFGILGPLFTNKFLLWLLWGILIVASLLTGHLLPGGSTQVIKTPHSGFVSLSDSLNRSIRNMALVCGWVVIFRVLLEFMDTYVTFFIPTSVRTILIGLLELSNGCLGLAKIQDESLRFLLAGFMLSLGGICVLMQTQAVFPELRLKQYITGRLLHCLICMFLSVLLIPMISEVNFLSMLPALIVTGCSILFLRRIVYNSKKEVAFYRFLMYND